MTEQYEDAPSWWEFPAGIAIMLKWPAVFGLMMAALWVSTR